MASAAPIRAGAAFIELGAKDDKLRAALRRASARVKAFGASLAGIGTRLAGFGLGALAGLGAMTKVFSDMGSELLDLSQRTGVSVEALGELGFAATQSGTDIETLELGLKEMGKSLDEATARGDTAAGSLARLGLTLQDLQGLTPDQRFKKIAARLVEVGDAGAQARIAADLFGRGGQKLVPMMLDLEKQTKRLQQLGGPMTKEEAEQAEAFGDVLGEIALVAKRFVATIGGELVPVVSALVKGVAPLIANLKAWFQANEGIVRGVGLVAAGVTALGVTLAGLGFVLSVVGAGLKLLLIPFTLLSGLLAVLQIKTVLSAVAWTAWAAVMVVVKAASLLASAAIGVLSAALAGTGIVTAVATFVAAAAALAALGLAAAVVGAALYGVWKAGEAVFQVLKTLPTTSGPLRAIGDIFSEWGTILQEVMRGLTADAPLAFEVLQSGAALAISQIRDLWPPLWEFIKQGWAAVAELAASTFVNEFQNAFTSIMGAAQDFFGIFGMHTKPIIDALRKVEGASKASEQIMDRAEKKLQQAAAGFQFEESAETKALRAALQEKRDQLAEAVRVAGRKTLSDIIKERLQGLRAGLGEPPKRAVTGGFSGALLGLMGPGSIDAKQLKELQKLNAQQQQLLDLARRGGILFAFT